MSPVPSSSRSLPDLSFGGDSGIVTFEGVSAKDRNSFIVGGGPRRFPSVSELVHKCEERDSHKYRSEGELANIERMEKRPSFVSKTEFFLEREKPRKDVEVFSSKSVKKERVVQRLKFYEAREDDARDHGDAKNACSRSPIVASYGRRTSVDIVSSKEDDPPHPFSTSGRKEQETVGSRGGRSKVTNERKSEQSERADETEKCVVGRRASGGPVTGSRSAEAREERTVDGKKRNRPPRFIREERFGEDDNVASDNPKYVRSNSVPDLYFCAPVVTPPKKVSFDLFSSSPSCDLQYRSSVRMMVRPETIVRASSAERTAETEQAEKEVVKVKTKKRKDSLGGKHRMIVKEQFR